MRKFASEYIDMEFVQQVVAQIPWSHNVVLMDRVNDINREVCYIEKMIKNVKNVHIILRRWKNGHKRFDWRSN